ncbi:MAG: amidase family protein [Verrucomicrobiia bacterium]
MTPEEYLQQDATALAALVRSSDVTPRELLDLAILRLEAVNPSLNAVVQKLYDFARKEIEAGLPEGPFRGVPFLLKDQTDLAGAVRQAATLCGNLGHEIIETKLPEELAGYREAASMMIRVNVFEQLEGIAAARGAKLRPDDVERATWTIYEAGKRASEDEYRRAVEEVRRAEQVMVQFGERFDLTLSPVLAEPPVALGVLDTMADDVIAMFGRLREYSPFCNLFNATGQPAMSIPMIWNDASLPIGSQFAGRFGDEATLFQLAGQIEEAAPWNHKYRDLWKTL